MKIITIGTLKGGTGKTTVAFNMAGILAKNKKKVLIIDADPQANISENFGIGQSFSNEYDTFANVLEDQIIPSFVILEDILNEPKCKIDIIPSNIELTNTETHLSILSMQRGIGHLQFQTWINKNKEILQKYDYIICDVGPNITFVTQNCLIVSDEIYLISDISVNGFKGAQLFMSSWQKICEDRNLENNIKGLIINRYDKRIALSSQFIDYINNDDTFSGKIFDTIIPDTVQFKYADGAKLPICMANPKCHGAVEFAKLIKEMQGKGLL